MKPEVVIATLPGRGPCTRAPSLCRVRPCAPKAGGAPDKEVLVPVCPEPLYCLDDYCGGCNYICISAVRGISGERAGEERHARAAGA